MIYALTDFFSFFSGQQYFGYYFTEQTHSRASQYAKRFLQPKLMPVISIRLLPNNDNLIYCNFHSTLLFHHHARNLFTAFAGRDDASSTFAYILTKWVTALPQRSTYTPAASSPMPISSLASTLIRFTDTP